MLHQEISFVPQKGDPPRTCAIYGSAASLKSQLIVATVVGSLSSYHSAQAGAIMDIDQRFFRKMLSAVTLISR
jgi:hypothetical protein